ncbi:capsular polysaccharide biosynthesis protein [hydrocarbon metagenome]|uniref:Capsular polysaccharide biosynthesis protein n=1 Tax=hydrocarbon metagenome TaxID=938273 RepID=A0A0W8FGW1_9ZZZZ
MMFRQNGEHMLRKGIFILAHQCGDPSFYSVYNKTVRNQWKPYDELKHDQEKQLKHLIGFAYEFVPYYRNLFQSLGVSPKDVRTIEDLEKLPILTKDIIKEHWEEFKPTNLSSIKHYQRATGGSTGTPLQYRLSKNDRFLGGALLYRGWGYGGFKLGNKMVILAGSSLDVGAKPSLVTKIHEISRSLKKLSSFDMGESEMREYAGVLKSFKPRFISGYASSLYFFARWLEENQVTVPSPVAVFATAEKLFPHMRKTIGEVFDCDVYDTYGLNDGGVTAFECPEHIGLHVDTERSIMEVVDGDGHQLECGEGRILATSLHNYAMPFIRYACDDEGGITDETCECGRGYPLLKEIVGRTTDVLVTPDGKNIHGWFFLYIFWDYGTGIKEYQVIQKTPERIVVNIVPEDGFDEKQLDRVRDIVSRRSPGWDLEFEYVDTIERTGAGKYKFVINEVCHAGE